MYKPDINMRPLLLKKREMPLRCMAQTKAGKPCRHTPALGEAFCATHLKQGYGLFTLAGLKLDRKTRGAR